MLGFLVGAILKTYHIRTMIALVFGDLYLGAPMSLAINARLKGSKIERYHVFAIDAATAATATA